MSKTIAEVIAGGMSPNGLEVMIKDADLKTTKDKKHYVSGVLTDNTGVIYFTVWDSGEIQDTMKQAGAAVIISEADFSLYKEKPQLTIRRASSIPLERAAASGIIPSSPISKKTLMDDFEKIVDMIVKVSNNSGFEKITDVLEQNADGFMDKFVQIPGAKGMHHAYLRGLLEHSVQVARLAFNAATVYSNYPSYNKIDKALLLTGALWHDIGKLDEYDLGPSGLVKRYSLAGGLATHMVIGAERLHKMYSGILSEHKLLQLKHIALSHHGNMEWGAVMEPATFEAYLVHHADMIDSGRGLFLESNSSSAELWDKPYGRGRILNPNFVFDDKTSIRL